MSSYFADYAVLPDGLAADVLLEIDAGRFVEVTPGALASGAQRLPGVVLPGFANCHSHAFHRALRGRTHAGGGTFWTWREQMYAIAATLDPQMYLDLARATYAEMALAGVTGVGEFHYLHHAPGAVRYAEPNAMGEALRAAAWEAGIRLTLLDTCYLAGGLGPDGHHPVRGVQTRFADRDVDDWTQRYAELREDDTTRIGAAIHSVRAVPRPALGTVADAAGDRPLHVHLSEQPAENDACQVYYRMTPTALLADAGVLAARTTAVHATHLPATDVDLLGSFATTCCICPTTERDLADGIGPAADLHSAGATLSLGTDQHAVIDMLEEARALEMDERLGSGERGRLPIGTLLCALTRHDSLGWPDAGRIAIGHRADLVATRLDTVRTAGCDPGQVIFAASAADVDTVLVDGRPVVRGGQHMLGDVGALLRDAIATVWSGAGGRG
jgi:formiminoglutamate deiminase